MMGGIVSDLPASPAEPEVAEKKLLLKVEGPNHPITRPFAT